MVVRVVVKSGQNEAPSLSLSIFLWRFVVQADSSALSSHGGVNK